MKFNLRDLFWLVLIAAMAIGWWLDRQYVARDGDRRERDALERVGFWMKAATEKDVELHRIKNGDSKTQPN